jgi:hypothetical protein
MTEWTEVIAWMEGQKLTVRIKPPHPTLPRIDTVWFRSRELGVSYGTPAVAPAPAVAPNSSSIAAHVHIEAAQPETGE